MRLRLLGTLDRYVLKQWLATFLLSAIGVPAVAVIIDLSEQWTRLAAVKHLPVSRILLAQLYLFPSKISILVPAAVLFATVFTLNAMGRHSELTAVQGGGISFYRLIAPMLALATLAIPLDYELQELAAVSTIRHRQLRGEESSAGTPARDNFAYASPSGWTWAFVKMTQDSSGSRASGLLGDRVQGDSMLRARGDSLRWQVVADSARWQPKERAWLLQGGTSYLIADSTVVGAFRFTGMRVNAFTEMPGELMKASKKAEEMTTSELRSYLDRLRLSGADAGTLSVELPLKYAVPVACLIVALFGAPLAITNARAGAAIGLAIALGTTLVYLTGTQIMKTVGGKGMLDPLLAAWSMNIVFFVLAVVLLVRVRS